MGEWADGQKNQKVARPDDRLKVGRFVLRRSGCQHATGTMTSLL